MPQDIYRWFVALAVAVVLVIGALAEAAEVKAAGDALAVRAGGALIALASPEIRDFEATVKAPGDYAEHLDAWDAWPGGTKEKPWAVGIGPKRDEQNVHVLGSLYQSILPESVVITSADGNKTFKRDEDYRYKEDSAQIAAINGRLGAAGQDELRVKLRYATQRIDLIQVDASGDLKLKTGTPRMVCPQLPTPDAGHRAIAGVYVAPWRRDGKFVVTQEDVFPIQPAPPVRPINPQALAGARKKLADNASLTIAFLGDSVTLGAEAGAWWADLWTENNLSYVSRVIVALRKRHPLAKIEPIHAAKGATTTKAAPAMFEEKITAAKPDVVMIAFGLNDAFGPVEKPNNPPETYKEDVRALVKKAKALGAEVILITPMQPNPWTSLGKRMPDYQKVLIELVNEEQVGCADVYTAWGNQASHGVPPFSQLHNWFNHPGSEAHAVYSETILRFFDPPEATSRAEAPANAATQPSIIPGQWAFGGEKDSPPLPELLAILAKAKPNPHLYGLYTWPGDYKTHRDAIRRVGWRSIRSGGPLDDNAMRMYVEDDAEVLYTLGVNGKLRPRLANDPKAVDELLVDYPQSLQTLLARYGPGGSFFAENPSLPNRPLRHVEIANEPNFQYVIPPDGRPNKQIEALRESLYAKLLPAAHRAIKEKWPDVTVVGFGAGGAGAGDLRFIRNVHGQDGAVAKSYDVLSTHPYVDPAPPEAFAIRSWGRYSIAGGLTTIRKTLAEQGRADAPIWYSEIGWPISKADGGRFETKANDMVSPLLQAAYVCRLYAFAQRLGVERVHVMFATDTDNFNAGFFLPDGTWRPSALAVCNMIRLMPRPKLVEAISDGANGVFVYRFESGDVKNTPVVIAWRVSGQSTLDVKLGANEAIVTDLFGVERQVQTTNGVAAVDIGPLPTYLAPAP